MSVDEQIGELEAIAKSEGGDSSGSSDFVPSAESIVPQEPQLSGAELCTGLFMAAFGLIASRRGAHWAINPDEATELGRATGAVLDKYLPGMKAGPEVALVGVVSMVLLPRVMAEAKAEEGVENRGDKSEHSTPE